MDIDVSIRIMSSTATMLDSHICKIDDEKFLLHLACTKDKVLLITGGASVVRKVMALQFAAHRRVKVVIEDRSVDGMQIFGTSHMAPLDAPHVMHNVILRFMGVNFSQFFEGSTHIPSSIGDNAKPLFADKMEETSAPISMNLLEQDKAMWEVYYSAGSAALVLVLIFIVIIRFLWCRIQNKHKMWLPMNNRRKRVLRFIDFFTFLVLSHLIGIITLTHRDRYITAINFDKSFMMDNT
ncbi:hypothetical protein IW262DRAFT_1493265 [Armillaria fumosa]|nr:hypothetical protein IW262DRAFT_1493265 [Armillaria fumosa]